MEQAVTKVNPDTTGCKDVVQNTEIVDNVFSLQ